jgi:HME family heavy-metal exporter
LHPVAVVIFGGLVSSTLLDTLLTPVLFWRFGEQATANLLKAAHEAASAAAGPSQESF